MFLPRLPFCKPCFCLLSLGPCLLYLFFFTWKHIFRIAKLCEITTHTLYFILIYIHWFNWSYRKHRKHPILESELEEASLSYQCWTFFKKMEGCEIFKVWSHPCTFQLEISGNPISFLYFFLADPTWALHQQFGYLQSNACLLASKSSWLIVSWNCTVLQPNERKAYSGCVWKFSDKPGGIWNYSCVVFFTKLFSFIAPIFITPVIQS